MHHISYDNQVLRLIIDQQFPQTLFHRSHAPERHQSSGCALAQFVTEMKISHGQPALRAMEKSEPTIEQNVGRDQCLIWCERNHAVGKYRLPQFRLLAREASLK